MRAEVLSRSYGIVNDLIDAYHFCHFPLMLYQVTQLSPSPCLFSNTPSPVPDVGLTCFSPSRTLSPKSFTRLAPSHHYGLPSISCLLSSLPNHPIQNIPSLHCSYNSDFLSSLVLFYSTFCDYIIYGSSWLLSIFPCLNISSTSVLHITYLLKHLMNKLIIYSNREYTLKYL